MGVFLLIDVAFFGANALKILQGGWLPLAVAVVLFTLMTTWRTGRQIVAERLASRAMPLSEFFALIDGKQPVRVAGTAVYMTAQGSGTPAGAGAQPAIQQGASRARGDSQRHHRATAALQ